MLRWDDESCYVPVPSTTNHPLARSSYYTVHVNVHLANHEDRHISWICRFSEIYTRPAYADSRSRMRSSAQHASTWTGSLSTSAVLIPAFSPLTLCQNSESCYWAQPGRPGGPFWMARSNMLTPQVVVEALVCPASAGKPQVQELAKRGVELRVLDIGGPVDVLIRAIDATSQLAQLNLAIAAKYAGEVRGGAALYPVRFHHRRAAWRCNATAAGHWSTLASALSARGWRLLTIYSSVQKEEVYRHVRRLYLPYTIIDAGYWYQLSFPQRCRRAAATTSPSARRCRRCSPTSAMSGASSRSSSRTHAR